MVSTRKSLAKKLAAFFDGEYELQAMYEDDDKGGFSDFQTRFLISRARRVFKIKSCLLVVALLLSLVAFTGFIITTAMNATQLEALHSQQQAAERLFWLSTTELKSNFQHRLTVQLQNRTGVGIMTKHPPGQCLAVAYKRSKGRQNAVLAVRRPSTAAAAAAAAGKASAAPFCSTRFNRFAANRTLLLLEDGFLLRDCLFATGAGGGRPSVKWCKEEDAVNWGAVLPSVTAVDVHNSGLVYFSLYNVKYPFECGAIDSQGFLTMEPCASKESQLFYLDGDNHPKQYESELVQLMRTIRSKNLLLD